MSLYKLAFLAAAGFSALYLLIAFQRFSVLRRRVRHAFLGIEVQLQRRYELIPKIAHTILDLLPDSNEALESLNSMLAARDRAVFASGEVNLHPADGSAMRKLLVAESALGSEMGLLLAIAEREGVSSEHPMLEELHEQLSDAEHHVNSQRDDFDIAVETFNHFLDFLPHRMLRHVFRLPRAEQFHIELSSARSPVYIAYS